MELVAIDFKTSGAYHHDGHGYCEMDPVIRIFC